MVIGDAQLTHSLMLSRKYSDKKRESYSKSDISRRLYEVFWRLKIYDNILWATYVTQWGIFYCTTFIQSVTNYIHGVVHSTLYVLETFLAFLTEFNLVKAGN